MVSSPEIKNILVFVLPKSDAYPRPSRPTRGAIARRHERGAGCGGRKGVRRATAVAGRDEPRERSDSVQDDRRLSGRQNRVVLAPVAGVKFAEASRPNRALDKTLIRG